MSAWNPSNLTAQHPTVRPTEKRQDIEFGEKDAQLRRDVHELGVILGELLREQCGEELYQAVEHARKAAIGRREGDAEASSRLDGILAGFSTAGARDFVRAFSTYFVVMYS